MLREIVYFTLIHSSCTSSSVTLFYRKIYICASECFNFTSALHLFYTIVILNMQQHKISMQSESRVRPVVVISFGLVTIGILTLLFVYTSTFLVHVGRCNFDRVPCVRCRKGGSFVVASNVIVVSFAEMCTHRRRAHALTNP